MNLSQYAKASTINLMILCAGIAIGRYCDPPKVNAQGASPVDPWTQEPEYVSPGFTVGTGGIGTLLANRISTDQLFVNGYDVLKLQDGILQLLQRKHVATFSESATVVDGAKIRLLRIKPIQTAPKSQEPPK